MLRVLIPDRPGNLAPLLRTVADLGANVVDVFHRRATALVPIDRVGVELILEVREKAHGAQVINGLRTSGYGVEEPGEWGGA